ncbi:MAG: hypothetical protein Q9219_002988 [cf. Caloplaca sp. 3 TL-2023]
MAAMSSGKKLKNGKSIKHGTSSKRKHRFESFSQRVARLNIDPIHKTRQNNANLDIDDSTGSHFKSDLDRWKDLNLSENFTNFVREVSSLCNTLPQVLHHQAQIVSALTTYIAKGDPLSLEPLLSLLLSFAHDLGPNFETHFSGSVTLVTSLATRNTDVEVIEWSFNCLAWLFKYLSRLLVPDLRPLLRIMLPLLGKEPQKLFIARFAAESLSFLLRKAAVRHRKDPKPLLNAISFLLDDVDALGREGKDAPLYYYGLEILFVDAIKGIDRNLHSSGLALYGCLLDKTLSDIDDTKGRMILLEGVTVGLIHHTEALTFKPVMEHCLQSIQQEMTQERSAQGLDSALQICERLLCVLSTVRKGTRVLDWGPILDVLLELLRLRQDYGESLTPAICETAVMVMQSASLDVLIPRVRPVMDCVANDKNQDQFLTFCSFFSQLNKERFDSLIHPYFVNYIRALDHMTVSSSTTEAIMRVLYFMIQSVLDSPNQINPKSNFSLGEGLKAYANRESKLQTSGPKIWQSVLDAVQYYKTLPPFLEGILVSMKADGLSSNVSMDSFVDQVIENLHSSSHVLRKLSLQIIIDAYEKVVGHEAEILATALAIESLPLDFGSARTLSMYVRKLASQYRNSNLHHWLQKAIPHFCFGIQTFKLSSIWDDATDVLRQICEAPQAENAVADLAFRLLETGSHQPQKADIAVEKSHGQSLDEFECSNLKATDLAFRDCTAALWCAKENELKKFQNDHVMSNGEDANAPAMALRVLLGIPKIAEKKSRHLVPMLLRWAAVDEYEEVPGEQTSGDEKIDDKPPKLNGQDRKTMLRLFGLFNNPRALYRADEVFEALRNLLANGDVEIQRHALNALFTWKTEALQPYRDSLLNLLDDSRFRDEMTAFLHGEDQKIGIQDGHRDQIMPILLRLLYGKLISRTGNQSAKRTQTVKRKVILETLSRFDDTEIQQFLNIAFGSLSKSGISDIEEGNTLLVTLHNSLVPRRRIGLLHLVKEMLNTLGTRLKPCTKELAKVVISSTVGAGQVPAAEQPEADDQESSPTSLFRSIRQMGLQCITLLFQHCTVQEIQPYLSTIFADLINPRLENLSIDTAQSVSGSLQLFSSWASSRQSVMFLVDYNPALLSSISHCLDLPFAKDEVKSFVLESILGPLVGLVEPYHAQSPDSEKLEIVLRVLAPNIDIFLAHLGGLLHCSPTKELLASAIDCLTRLAPFVQGSSQIRNIIESASFLLTQSSQRVSPRTKGALLQTLQHLMPQHDFLETPDLQDMMFTTTSSLFGYFRDRDNRATLVQVFLKLAVKDQALQNVARLCKDLNSYSANKVDEPDFDTRLQAFNTINEQDFKSMTVREWRPILYNMLFFIRDTEELAIRTSASFALRRFIEANPVPTGHDGSESSSLTKNILLPALRKGASETSELVRAEYLAVMASLVRSNPDWHEVSDMNVLLVMDDEEASFFNNVLHIQQHRRLRALRRLAAESRCNHLNSKNVAHFFMPLVEHFVFDRADDDSAHNLSSEAVTTIGALAQSLEWPQFRAVFRRYLSLIDCRPDLEKTTIKLVGVLAESVSSTIKTEHIVSTTGSSERVEDQEAALQRRATLARTLPKQEKLTEDVTTNLLPALTKYLHAKDESTVSLRVPIAVSAAKLLKTLPPSHIEDRLPSILTDICNILRSRAPESRDLTRKTLADIAVVVGPAYFGFILKELRRALTRGYQLHVLSYTVHSILIGTGSIFVLGDLDYCLPQLVAVIMDDTFGATGQEKDAEEYISKMKEVKSSKSYDSMEIIAKSATAESFLYLIRPLQSLLDERLDLRTVRKIDELLRRISMGLLHNESIESRQVLVFCHEIIREVYRSGEEQGHRANLPDPRNKRFLINTTGDQKLQAASTSSSRYKLIRFALDLVRLVLHKYDSLQTPANLTGFIPMLGDAMIHPSEEIRMSALRLLTTIIKVPLQDIDNNAAIYVAEAVRVVRASPSTKTEFAQAALKLVSAILRERRDVEVREADLAYLLKRIQPDLEELDRQGVAFNFLKAVVSREIVIVEIYEVLERVASMMITSQTRGARDQARSLYFDFLINYPQSKGRFTKQLTFLVKNLEYKHPEGRQSVMEAVHLLFSKVGNDLLQSVLETFFVPLVMVIINDDSAPCREMAGFLLQKGLEKADGERSDAFLTLLRTWLSQLHQPLLVRVALQVYGIFMDTQQQRAEKELSFFFAQLTRILEANPRDHGDADWEILHFALQSLLKVCKIFPNASFAPSTAPLWTCVHQYLFFPHTWVKVSVTKLQGMLFADIARTNAKAEQLELPLKGSSGLRLEGSDLVQITRASFAVLKVVTLNEELATQTVRNLVFLAKMMNSTSLEWGASEEDAKSAAKEGGIESECESSESETKQKKQSGVHFIIRRASAILRRGPQTTREPSLVPVKAAMQLVWALCNNLPIEAVKPGIEILLLPLHNLTDPSIPPPFSSDDGFVDGYKALVAHGSEIMAILQKRMGTTDYVMHLSKVRAGIRERRENRRVKRRIEAVAEPEKMGRLKQRKGEKKKEKRKEKSAGQRSKRRGW